jgi:hypothetical protein
MVRAVDVNVARVKELVGGALDGLGRSIRKVLSDGLDGPIARLTDRINQDGVGYRSLFNLHSSCSAFKNYGDHWRKKRRNDLCRLFAGG